ILFQVLDRCWEEHAILPGTQQAWVESPWIDISADDRFLVRAMSDGNVRLVDLDTATVARMVRHANTGQTTAAFCSGNRLLTGGSDGCLRSFDVATGNPLRSWQAHASATGERLAIARIAVANDGSRATSCGGDGPVALIDPDRDDLILCRGHEGGVDFVTFDPEGSRIATGGGHTPNATRGDRTVRVFDAHTGKQLQLWGPFAGPMRWIEWSHDRSRIVIARDENCADICDVATGQTVLSLPHGGPVYWAAFDAGDLHVVTGSPDGVSVFDASTARRVAHHTDFKDRSVYRGAFSPDGTRLAVIAWDDTARIYDTATWQPVRTFCGVATRALGICWNHGGTRIATVGGGLQTWYADVRPFLPALLGHRDRVTSAVFAPDDQRVLTASVDGDARIWDAQRGTTLTLLSTGAPLRRARFSPDGRSVLTIAETALPALFDPARHDLGPALARDGWFAPDGRIVLAGADGVLRLHDPKSGALLHAIACHTGPIVSAAFHPHRPWIATGGNDRTYRIVDLEHNVVLHAPPPWPGGTIGEREQVFSLAFDPTGRWLFAACEDVMVRSIDLEHDFACRSLMLGPTPGRLAVTRDGESLLVGAQWGGRLHVVSTRDMARVGIAAAQHANLIVALELQPNSDLALSASKDGTVAIFEPRSNRLVSVIHASDVPLLDAHFSHDGTRIVTAAADGQVRIWPTDPLAVALRFRPARPAHVIQQR
ncbi:MAG: WD40 repeat domain-containing protein, partial [Planctomycetota bacterium]